VRVSCFLGQRCDPHGRTLSILHLLVSVLCPVWRRHEWPAWRRRCGLSSHGSNLRRLVREKKPKKKNKKKRVGGEERRKKRKKKHCKIGKVIVTGHAYIPPQKGVKRINENEKDISPFRENKTKTTTTTMTKKASQPFSTSHRRFFLSFYQSIFLTFYQSIFLSFYQSLFYFFLSHFCWFSLFFFIMPTAWLEQGDSWMT
jgi:hypothetical protein